MTFSHGTSVRASLLLAADKLMIYVAVNCENTIHIDVTDIDVTYIDVTYIDVTYMDITYIDLTYTDLM